MAQHPSHSWPLSCGFGGGRRQKTVQSYVTQQGTGSKGSEGWAGGTTGGGMGTRLGHPCFWVGTFTSAPPFTWQRLRRSWMSWLSIKFCTYEVAAQVQMHNVQQFEVKRNNST